MISTESITRLSTGGGDVLDSTGDKIGSIAQLYVDDRSTQPSWVTVRTGLFGMRESFVPLDDATEDGINIRVPYTRTRSRTHPTSTPTSTSPRGGATALPPLRAERRRYR